MGILDRLGRSIKANLNSMIDKAEDPAKVITLNVVKFIRMMPAGIEMTWRITGKSRAKKMPPASYRRTHLSARSSLCSLSRK